MARFVPKLAFLMAAITACGMANAGSNEADAKKLLGKAVEFAKANGRDKFIAECNNTTGQFNSKSDVNPNGDMYIFTMKYDGLQDCHGRNAKIRGKNTIDMKDQNGVQMIKTMIEHCKSKGSGSVDYVWPNPETKALDKKRAFVEKLPYGEECVGTGIHIGSGG